MFGYLPTLSGFNSLTALTLWADVPMLLSQNYESGQLKYKQASLDAITRPPLPFVLQGLTDWLPRPISLAIAD